MKIKYFILTFIMLIAGSILTGCNSNRENKVDYAKENVKQASQDLKDAQVQYEKEWRQFKSDADLKITDNEKSIAKLKVKIKTGNKKLKAKYEKWEEFKQGFNHDMDVVGKSIKDFFSDKD
jgi:flagellar motility protein MotE (MotC chaperone)